MSRSQRRWRVAGILAVVGVALLAMAATGIAAWEYTNSDAFCTNACHAVHPEEPEAHQASQHSSVECVECHLGRLSTFPLMLKKVGHTAHAWALLTGYDRPLTSPSMPPARESCEGCHSRQPHRHNSIRVQRHFAPDEANTQTRVGLVLRTAGRQLGEPPAEDLRGRGIHWHTEHQVRFIATDEHKRNIPWIEVTRRDGSVVTYMDETQPLTEEAIAAADKSNMECVDCHNRTGHPFPNPDRVVDEAMATGELSRQLPFVKARVVALLKQKFEDEQQALALVEEAWAAYERDFPDVEEQYPEAWEESKRFAQERQRYAVKMLLGTRFNEPGVSWRSFPDHRGHKDSPGCFRCHSGKHRDQAGNLLRVRCTLCHGVPIIVHDDGVIPNHLLKIVDLPKPPEHSDQDFMTQHRNLVDESCEICHGEVKFGTDDKSFCSNSACHGTKWPNLVRANG